MCHRSLSAPASASCWTVLLGVFVIFFLVFGTGLIRTVMSWLLLSDAEVNPSIKCKQITLCETCLQLTSYSWQGTVVDLLQVWSVMLLMDAESVFAITCNLSLVMKVCLAINLCMNSKWSQLYIVLMTLFQARYGHKMPQKAHRLLGRGLTLIVALVVLAFGLVLLLINLYELRLMQQDHMLMHGSVVEGQADRTGDKLSPVVWIEGRNVSIHYCGHDVHIVLSSCTSHIWSFTKTFFVFDTLQQHTGYMKHIHAVFDRLGYAHGGPDSDWDVLWSHDYPFIKLKDNISSLKPHQKVAYIVNHLLLFFIKRFCDKFAN